VSEHNLGDWRNELMDADTISLTHYGTEAKVDSISNFLEIV
jgi:hypothetical protein